MSKNLLDNGTVLTLGLVGAVAAVGAVRKRGSATTIEPKSPDDRPGMYELVDKTPSLALWKKTYGKTYWLITDYEGNAQLPYGHQDDYPTVFKTLTRAMKVWNTLSTGGAVEVTNAQALRGLGFNQQEHGREQKGSRAKRAETFSVGDKVKHKRDFLRSIGWMTNVPRNGVVRSVTDGFSGRQLLEVAWSDGTTSKIISPNVTHAGKVELV